MGYAFSSIKQRNLAHEGHNLFEKEEYLALLDLLL